MVASGRRNSISHWIFKVVFIRALSFRRLGRPDTRHRDRVACKFSVAALYGEAEGKFVFINVDELAIGRMGVSSAFFCINKLN